nr:MAG TPA: hypothetical protein [Caudoviricetes sp.]
MRNCVLKCWHWNEISGVVMGMVGGGFTREKIFQFYFKNLKY